VRGGLPSTRSNFPTTLKSLCRGKLLLAPRTYPPLPNDTQCAVSRRTRRRAHGKYSFLDIKKRPAWQAVFLMRKVSNQVNYLLKTYSARFILNRRNNNERII
jgi:hypothetical protein